MQNSAEAIRRHYEPAGGDAAWFENIKEAIAQFGEGPLTAAKLAPLDQFHVRGLPATKELADLAGIVAGMKVLDAGSGIGGPARYLAEVYGCQVTGVDLTPGFVQLATLLAQRTGLSNLVTFEVGDLRALRFPDGHFDLIWTQHVMMNIPERVEVYRELHRVLAPGGRLVFFDLYAPDESPALTFPVPWAESPAMSFLLTKAETLEALREAGFAEGVWNDVTEQTRAALASGQAPAPPPAGSPQALTLAAVMGPRFRAMLANLQGGVRAGLIRLVMGMYYPAGSAGKDANS